MEVYALVGKSGTGKSHKALMVAHDNDIDYIIDDGILIYRGRVLAGNSAKKSKTKMEAVRIAIFEFDSHQSQVRAKLDEIDPEKILIIGTSDRMVGKIAKRLELGKIKRTIYIEEVATAEEIEMAKSTRMNHGTHVVPLPSVEVKKHFSGILKNPMKLFFRHNKKDFEKTLVRPSFSYIGRYYISQKAIKQIIRHEGIKFDCINKIYSIGIEREDIGVRISIDAQAILSQKSLVESIRNMQKTTIENLESMTQINILSLDINVVDAKLIQSEI